MRILSIVAAATLLGACAAPAPTTQPDAAEGDKAKPGAVIPIKQPVVVRHAALSGIAGSGIYEVQRFDGQQQTMDLRWRLDVKLRDGRRIWDLRVTEANIDGRRARSDDPPLIRFRADSAGPGTVDRTEIEFPYYQSRGAKNVPTKGSVAYADFERTLRHFLVPVPATSYKTGDLLLTPEQNAQRLAAYLRLGARDTEAHVVRTNTLRTEVVGELWEQGRQRIVARHLGSAETGDARAGMRLTQSGHVVVDVQTGQVTAQVTRINLTRSIDGTQATAIALIRSTQTF